MKKLLLTLMLVVVSSSAVAEWIEVTRDKEKLITYYADPNSIKKTGDINIVKMSVLTDYTTIRTNVGKPYLSKFAVWQYNCKEKQNKSSISTLKSKNMGEGKFVSLGPVIRWKPVLPGSNSELFWKLACGK